MKFTDDYDYWRFSAFLSFAILVVSLVVRFAFAGNGVYFIFDSAVSCSIVLLVPYSIENAVVALSNYLLIPFVWGALLVLSASHYIMGESVVLLAYLLLTLLPVVMCAVGWQWNRMNDREFLGSTITGWQVAWQKLKLVLIIVYILAILFEVFVLGLSKAYRWAGYVISPVFHILSLFFLFRNITASLPDFDSLQKEQSSARAKPKRNLEESDAHLYERFSELMEVEKYFLRPKLSVGDVCKALGTNKSYLSRAINLNSGEFQRTVNRYRVEYAMSLFSDNTNLKSGELMEKSGFGNSTTFINAFKIITGHPPGEWCANYRESLSKSKVT